MNEFELQELLLQLLNGEDCEDGLEQVYGADTFVDRGVMTDNAGLVIRTQDGNEYQLTLVRSR